MADVQQRLQSCIAELALDVNEEEFAYWCQPQIKGTEQMRTTFGSDWYGMNFAI